MVDFSKKGKAAGVAKARERLISSEDASFIGQVYADYEAAKESKPVEEWRIYDEYVEDDQWEMPTAKDEWKPRPQINICWKVLQTIHANITSGKTSINVTCRKPFYEDVAQQIGDGTEYYWNLLDMDLKINEAEWIRPKLGAVCLKVPWNPNLNYDQEIKDYRGDVDTEVVHPGNIFPDPNITNPWRLQRCDFIDVAMPKTVKYILQHYSKEHDDLCRYAKKELREILIPENSFEDTEIYGESAFGVGSRVPEEITGKATVQRNLNTRSRVNLHEYWYRDDNGRLQVAWIAGQVLLKHTIDDEEMRKNGFYKHGKYPFVIVPYIQRDKRMWGRSEMKSLVSTDGKRDGIQDIINKLAQDYLVNQRLVGQGQVAYRHGAIKNPEKLTGEAGLTIPVKGNPNQDIRRIQGIPMNGTLDALESFLTHADRITNLWDVTQGRSTPYTKTAQGTIALMEQAMRPQHDKIATMNQGLREWAEILWAHLTEFADYDKEFVVNKGNDQRVFTFNPASVMKMPVRNLDADGQIIVEDPERTSELYFNFKFDVGATIAITKAYLMELGVNLWGQKAIDIEGLYMLLPEFPGKQETLERLKAMNQQPPGQPPPIPGQEMPPGEEGQQPQNGEQTAQFLKSLPPEVIMALRDMQPEQQAQIVQEMMQMPPDQLQDYIMQLVGGGGGGEEAGMQADMMPMQY